MNNVIFKQNNKIGFCRGSDRFSNIPKVREYGLKAVEYFKTGKYIDYITRDEACFNYDGKIPTFETDAEALMWFNRHTKIFNKTNNESNVNSGLYGFNTKTNKFECISLADGKEWLSNLNDEQFIWDTHLSFGQAGIQNRIFKGEDIAKLLEDNLNYFLIRNNLNLNNLNAMFAIHANTNNPHIHLAFWERQKNLKYPSSPTLQYKKDGLIPLAEWKRFGLVLTNKINEKMLYDEYYKSVANLRDTKLLLKDSVKQNDLEIINKANLINDFLALKPQNIWNYARLSAECKSMLNDIVINQINENEELANNYFLFQNQISNIKAKFSNNPYQLNQTELMIKKEQSELNSSLGNLILKKLQSLTQKNNNLVNFKNSPNFKLISKNNKKILPSFNYKYELNKMKYDMEKLEITEKIKSLQFYEKSKELTYE